jgi:hypothetical protein
MVQSTGWWLQQQVLWRSENYSDVLINYFGENAMIDEGDAMEKNTISMGGLDKRGSAHETACDGPKGDGEKTMGWFWIRKC